MSTHVERLFSAVTTAGDKPALVFEGRTWTFADLDRLSRQYARGLAGAGLSAGHRVAVYAETSPEVVVALLGHYRLGVLHVPINSRYRGDELSHILRDSGAEAILLGGKTVTERVLDEIVPPPALRHRILMGSSSSRRSGDLAFEQLVATELSRGEAEAPPVSRDADTAILLYTSGTTGKSKGVKLSFGAIVENMEAVTRLWRFEPSIVSAFADGDATVFQGVPTMYVRLLEHLAGRPQDARALSKARLFTAGSAALSADDFAAFEDLTGHRILERYGMTETLFTLSNPYEDRRPGTVGMPVPGCEVRIVDEGGREMPAGDPGEILVKSNGIMSGYWGKPAETAASFVDGWFTTGDVARRDGDGYVTMVGRKSVDVIKSGGFKISAREIEDVLARHPRVKEVAVVGAPDRIWGQRIVAVVVLEGSSAAPSEAALLAELSSFCARQLADYKRPRAVKVFEELPRNALGKIQKHRILERL